MIARLEPDIRILVQKLCDKLLRESGQKPFDITMAYSCFTSDAISGYSFGESFGFLDQDGWFPNFREPLASILRPVFIFRFFPFTKASAGLGKYLVDYMPPGVALMVRTLQIDLPARMKKAKADIDAGIKYDRPTVFGTILESDVTALDKEPQRLADEAAAVIGAGTETTSWAMSVITYHLLTKPELLTKLKQELQSLKIPDNCHPGQHLRTYRTLGPWSKRGCGSRTASRLEQLACQRRRTSFSRASGTRSPSSTLFLKAMQWVCQQP